MKNLDDLHAEKPGQGFQFPGAFEITAVGKAHAGIEERMPELITGLGMAVLNGSLHTRPSSEGNYVSVSLTFTCP